MAMAVAAGTYRLAADLAEALDDADPADAASLGVDHAEGTTIEVAGLILTCGAGPCRVTLNEDGTVTITGTIWTAGYMPPPTAEDVAAATAAAATKRTAIAAEAGERGANDAGLGGSAASALTAGDAGSYELAIARDRMATTITVTVNGATDADDVTFTKAADLEGAAGHKGQMQTRAMEADADGNVMTEVAVVVTDIQAPMAVAVRRWCIRARHWTLDDLASPPEDQSLGIVAGIWRHRETDWHRSCHGSTSTSADVSCAGHVV